MTDVLGFLWTVQLLILKEEGRIVQQRELEGCATFILPLPVEVLRESGGHFFGLAETGIDI
jgi:hypothetical protein